MSEHSIQDLLGSLPEPSSPDPEFEARLRARLTAEWRAGFDKSDPHSADPDSADHGADQFSNTEVIEVQTLTRTPTKTPKPRHTWLRAAAVIAVIAGAVAVLVAIQRDDDPPAIAPTPQTTPPTPATSAASVETTAPSTATTAPAATETLVGSSLDSFRLDLATNPYFVGAADEVWVSSLAGELARLDTSTGEILARASIPESSPIAVDASAVWVADAIDGDVIRLDPIDGSEVARIATGVEILENSFRQPMLEGTARNFAQLGGIVSTDDAVWVGDKAGAVMRIDPATNTIVATFDVPVRPDLLRAEGRQLLVADLLGAGLAVIDTDDGTVLYESGRLDDMAGAALYGGAVYRQDRATGTVTRIDLATSSESISVALGPPQEREGTPTLPTGLTVSGAGVLVDTTSTPESLHILDPVTLQEIGTLATAPDQGDMAIATDGTVWIVRSLANEVVRITPVPL